jgi:type IV pilus assembly protein PilY1
VTNLTTGITALGDNDAGWYYDLLGKTAGGATERIVIDPEAAAGQFEIAWGSLVPTSDPCSFQGTIYAADFSTGQTTLVDSTGASVASITTKTALTTLKMVQVPGSGSGSSATPGQILLMYGESGLSVGTAKLKPGAGAATVARVNWREVLN